MKTSTGWSRSQTLRDQPVLARVDRFHSRVGVPHGHAWHTILSAGTVTLD
jgi:hypothetical protein